MSIRLQDVLVREGLLTADASAAASAHAASERVTFEVALVALGLVDDKLLANAIAIACDHVTVDLDDMAPDAALAKSIPRELALKHGVVLVSAAGATLFVAFAGTPDLIAADEIRFITGYNVEPVIATAASIARAQERLYPVYEEPMVLDDEMTAALYGDFAADLDHDGLAHLDRVSLPDSEKLAQVLLLAAVQNGVERLHLSRRAGRLIIAGPAERSFDGALFMPLCASLLKMSGSAVFFDEATFGSILLRYRGNCLHFFVTNWPCAEGFELELVVNDAEHPRLVSVLAAVVRKLSIGVGKRRLHVGAAEVRVDRSHGPEVVAPYFRYPAALHEDVVAALRADRRLVVTLEGETVIADGAPKAAPPFRALLRTSHARDGVIDDAGAPAAASALATLVRRGNVRLIELLDLVRHGGVERVSLLAAPAPAGHLRANRVLLEVDGQKLTDLACGFFRERNIAIDGTIGVKIMVTETAPLAQVVLLFGVDDGVYLVAGRTPRRTTVARRESAQLAAEALDAELSWGCSERIDVRRPLAGSAECIATGTCAADPFDRPFLAFPAALYDAVAALLRPFWVHWTCADDVIVGDRRRQPPID